MPATLNAVMWVLSVSRKRFDALGVKFEKPCNWILIWCWDCKRDRWVGRMDGPQMRIVLRDAWHAIGLVSVVCDWDGWGRRTSVDTGSEKLTHPTIYFIVCMRSEQLKRRSPPEPSIERSKYKHALILKMGLLDIMSHEACRHGNFGRQGHRMDRCAQADLERPDFKCFPKLKAQIKQADNQHVPVAKCRMSGQSRRSSVLVTC